MSKAIVVGTHKRLCQITQSLDAIITTIGVEVIVVPNMDFVRRGMVIASVTNLGCGSNGFSMGRNLRSLGLPVTNTGVIGTP